MLMMIPFAAFSMGLILGYLPMRACRPDVTGGFAALLVALTGWTLFKEMSVPGMDGMVYTLVGVFVLAPALIATLIGAALAHVLGHVLGREIC